MLSTPSFLQLLVALNFLLFECALSNWSLSTTSPFYSLPITSSFFQDLMRRGYTREAYLDLVTRVKEVIPNVQISGDLVNNATCF
jgi:hypothetical protein